MGHVFFFLGRLGLLLGLRQGHVSRFALASCQSVASCQCHCAFNSSALAFPFLLVFGQGMTEPLRIIVERIMA